MYITLSIIIIINMCSGVKTINVENFYEPIKWLIAWQETTFCMHHYNTQILNILSYSFISQKMHKFQQTVVININHSHSYLRLLQFRFNEYILSYLANLSTDFHLLYPIVHCPNYWCNAKKDTHRLWYEYKHSALFFLLVTATSAGCLNEHKIFLSSLRQVA